MQNTEKKAIGRGMGSHRPQVQGRSLVAMGRSLWLLVRPLPSTMQWIPQTFNFLLTLAIAAKAEVWVMDAKVGYKKRALA